MNTKPLTSLYLDTRRAKGHQSDSANTENPVYPIKIRITFNRERRYFSINNLVATKQEFEKIMSGKLSNDKTLKKKKAEAETYKRAVEDYLFSIPVFSFRLFKDEFLNKPEDKETDVFSVFQAYIDELTSEGRLNTRDSYKYALKALKSFRDNRTFLFDAVDHRFLKRFEAYLIKEGYSITSIGIWMRSFRTIVNIAIKRGYLASYPFGKGEYQIANPPARKMALTTEELKKIFQYEPDETHSEAFYFDLWKFAYLCSGINVKDICHLKYGNIERDKIFYLREKTKRTNLRGKEIVIPLSDDIRRIIEKHGQRKINDSTYLFKILKHSMDESQKKAQVTQTTKQINKYIRKAAQKMGIEVKISTYTARHSYATQLMRHGAPTAFISKQLGHSNIKTTADYLEHFEDRQLNEWQQKITDFNL